MDKNSEMGKPQSTARKYRTEDDFETIRSCLCFTSVRSLHLLLPIDTSCTDISKTTQNKAGLLAIGIFHY